MDRAGCGDGERKHGRLRGAQDVSNPATPPAVGISTSAFPSPVKSPRLEAPVENGAASCSLVANGSAPPWPTATEPDVTPSAS